MRPYMSLLTVVLVAVFALPLKAQKFAYVESQRILNEYQEYQDVQKQLEQLRSKYDAEYQQMVKEYNALLEEIDSQSLLLSPEKKQQKMQAAQDKAMQIEQYKYEKLGPEGEFYKKSMELTRPIIDKINKLIAKIGEEEGYDFIFDASSGALVHALPKYDITDRIIEELNKGVSTTKK
ncbi:MAG: OmpH family outer membrane protein [Caldisericaceae bacterium]|nr:OmpH family outer membrane protein [Caldisericaceae bacterium]